MPKRRKMNKLTFGRQKFNGADRLAPLYESVKIIPPKINVATRAKNIQ